MCTFSVLVWKSGEVAAKRRRPLRRNERTNERMIVRCTFERFRLNFENVRTLELCSLHFALCAVHCEVGFRRHQKHMDSITTTANATTTTIVNI